MQVRKISAAAAILFLATATGTAEARRHPSQIGQTVPNYDWRGGDGVSTIEHPEAAAKPRFVKRKSWRKSRARRHSRHGHAKTAARRPPVAVKALLGSDVPLPRQAPVRPSYELMESHDGDRLWTTNEIVAGVSDPRAAERAIQANQPRPALPLLPGPLRIINIFSDYIQSLIKPAGNYVKMTCPDGSPLHGVLRDTLSNAATHFGKPVLVTSAYRSPSHNKAVGGASRSQHMKCRALDFRVVGVPKDTLLAWARKQHGLKGFGRYCSEPIHVDMGPARSWDWCGGRRHAARRAQKYRQYASR